MKILKSKFNFFILLFIIAVGFICSAELFSSKNVANINVFANDESEIILPSAYCMRDDYYLQTSNQYNQGLCWDFASNTAFTTTVMKSTNQYIDYSEGWVSTEMAYRSNYTPGDGGVFNWHNESITTSGIVQEQDFYYENSYQVTKENAQHYYELYSQYADKTIVKNYNVVNLNVTNWEDEEEKQDFITQAKQHILNNGGLYVDFGWASTTIMHNNHWISFKIPNLQSYSTSHAVCIVGWDDDLEVCVDEENVYKGAWIFINSWGTDANSQGMYYLFYDDQAANSFQGYEYVEEYDDLYFFNKLTDSNANFITQYKNAYTGNFEATNGDTKQKNVFYNTNIPTLTYSYKISNNTNINAIEIFKNQTDVSENFDCLIGDNSITISAKTQLDLGAYKIVWTYSNQSEVEKICGAFYILNATEIADIRIFSSASVDINKSNALQGSNSLQYGCDYFIYGITDEEMYLNIQIYPATYSKLKQVFLKDPSTNETLASSDVFTSSHNYLIIRYTFNFSEQTTYDIYMTYYNDFDKTYKLYFKMVDCENESFACVNYSLDGGENNPNNQKAVVINHSEYYEIENPTKKGYGFAGWYYTSNFEESSLLKIVNGKFVLEYENIIHYDTCSTYWSNISQELIPYNFNSFIIYAKWVKLEQGKIYHTIISNVVGDGYISEQGLVFVEHGQTKSFDINCEGYHITDAIVDGQILNSIQIQFLEENGLTFENISQDHYFSFVFTPRTDTPYKVNYYLQSLEETSYVFNNKYYTLDNSKNSTGTTNELTNEIVNNLYPHYFALNFEQQMINPDGSTIINIYFDRETYNITLTFNGIKNNSTKYDVNENVLFGESKTYTIKLIGYVINECKLDGRNVQFGQTISLNNIDSNHIVVVNVEERLHNITYDVGQNGEINCDSSLNNIKDGEVRNFIIVANEGYILKEVCVNDEMIEVINGEFSLIVDQDYDIRVIFQVKDKNIFTPILIGIICFAGSMFLFMVIALIIKVRKSKFF